MSTVARTIDDGNREAWLAERQTGIGASEAAAALGLDPYTTPLALWAIKRGIVPPFEGNEATRWGHRLQPLVLDAYAEQTGRTIEGVEQFARSADRPHLFATIDALDSDGDVVEVKTTSRRLGDGLPDGWLVQVQQQMYVHGRDRAVLAVLQGGNRLTTHVAERDAQVLDAILPRLDAFWASVADEDAEPPEPFAEDAALVGRLYGCDAGAFDADTDLALSVREYEILGHQIAELQARRDLLKAGIGLDLRGRVAVLPDGGRVTYKQVHRKEYTVKAGSYWQMSITKGVAK